MSLNHAVLASDSHARACRRSYAGSGRRRAHNTKPQTPTTKPWSPIPKPHAQAILSGIREEAGTERVAVLACGPEPLMETTAQAARASESRPYPRPFFLVHVVYLVIHDSAAPNRSWRPLLKLPAPPSSAPSFFFFITLLSDTKVYEP